MLKMILIPLLIFSLIITGIFVFFSVSDYHPIHLQGESMSPVIPDDALVVSKPLPKQIEIGQIIIFYSREFKELVTHRIIGKTNDGRFVTKGDHNNEPDDLLISREDIKGVFVGYIPFLGPVLTWLEDYAYLILISISTEILLTILLLIKNYMCR